MLELNLNDILYMANCSKNANKITLHWSAGDYDTCYGDYHISITGDGRYFTPVDSFDTKLEHTWNDNKNNIGICINGLRGSYLNSESDYSLGDCPPTEAQIEALVECVYTILRATGIPVDEVRTHAERALEKGYGPYQGDSDTRWDLWFLREGDKHGRGGDEIRQKLIERS